MKALDRMAQYIIENTGTGCTDWNGAKDQDGYPMFWYRGKTRRASRILWELVYGAIPVGLVVRHICDNPACLQIHHLQLGTPKDNTRDALDKGRMRGPVKMTAEKIAQLHRLSLLGYPRSEIAALLEISVSTLYNYLAEEEKRAGDYFRGPR